MEIPNLRARTLIQQCINLANKLTGEHARVFGTKTAGEINELLNHFNGARRRIRKNGTIRCLERTLAIVDDISIILIRIKNSLSNSNQEFYLLMAAELDIIGAKANQVLLYLKLGAQEQLGALAA